MTAIGDWVYVVLKDDGSPVGICETATRVEICEVIGIVEEDGRLFVHLAGENDERFKVGYYNIHHISLCDEELQNFGFESCDGDKFTSDWLYEEHRWRLDCREIGCPDFGYFYISWNTDELELGLRSYRIFCRGYGKYMVLLEDTIAELQHWFFRYNSEYPMPLKYKGRTHFPTPKAYKPKVGPIFEEMKLNPRLIAIAKEEDGATYCSSDCPRTVDDGCVLHMLRMRCAEKGK